MTLLAYVIESTLEHAYLRLTRQDIASRHAFHTKSAQIQDRQVTQSLFQVTHMLPYPTCRQVNQPNPSSSMQQSSLNSRDQSTVNTCHVTIAVSCTALRDDDVQPGCAAQVFMLSGDAVLNVDTLSELLGSGHSRVPVHMPGNRYAPIAYQDCK